MTPIVKNSNSEGKQTVRIISADGEEIGRTYPRRAAGLVRKGRARYVNDSIIRLNVSDVTQITEETKMDNNTHISLNKQSEQVVNRLYFNAREWTFNKDCQHNVGNRTFMQGPDGIIAEAYMIGNWGHNWTEIKSRTLTLPKNTLNTFTFWLNGGENDQNDEVCRLEILFNNDYENRYIYNLNRNFIHPVKKCNGWELYEIPFMTGDNEYTELRFVAQRAYMTVLTAKDVSEYADLPETVDEFESLRPQRHNIIFADGFPTNTWYSTKRLAENNPECVRHSTATGNAPHRFSSDIEEQMEAVNATASGLSDMATNLAESILSSLNLDGIRESILQSLKNTGNEEAEEMVEEIMDSLTDSIDDLTDSITDSLENIAEEITDALESVQISINELDED